MALASIESVKHEMLRVSCHTKCDAPTFWLGFSMCLTQLVLKIASLANNTVFRTQAGLKTIGESGDLVKL